MPTRTPTSQGKGVPHSGDHGPKGHPFPVLRGVKAADRVYVGRAIVPDRLSFIVLGVGDAFSARYYSSCLAVHCEGAWLLVDCPHPIRKMMKEAPAAAQVGLDVGSIDALLVTHLHADHCSGIEGFLYFASFVTKRRPRLLAHPDVLSRLWSGHLSAGWSGCSHRRMGRRGR